MLLCNDSPLATLLCTCTDYDACDSHVILYLRYPCCVCNNEVKGKVSQNTTSFIGVNEMTCFGLLGGHHQVCKVLRD